MKIEELYHLFKQSSGISTDSRNVSWGELFFALKGERFDGNKYALQALKNGAMMAVVDDPVVVSDGMVLVDDSLKALQSLATFYRNKLGVKVFAITGTNGKTTTKELVSSVLAKRYRVHPTKGNLNNQIGVPLTILSATPDTDIMIVEMGASHPGDIEELCEIAGPDFGMITNIGKAHIEGFGDIGGVIGAKTELYRYLKLTRGVAFYNDNDRLLSDQINLSGVAAVPFSCPGGSLSLSMEVDKIWPTLELSMVYGENTFKVKTLLFGEYNLDNIKSAISTGIYFGVKAGDIVNALEEYLPSNNRSQIKKTSSNTLICDAYNANPVSMRRAIMSFFAIPAGKKVCILGDMLELGETALREHRDIVDMLAGNEPEKVILVGEMFSASAEGSGFILFRDAGEAESYLKTERIEGATVLLKGSRGIGLERLYQSL